MKTLFPLIAVFFIVACGPSSEHENCCTGSVMQELPCNPDVDPCPVGPSPDPTGDSKLYVTITNADELQWLFTFGVSAMDANRTVVYSNATPLSGTPMAGGAIWGQNLVLTAKIGQYFTMGAYGYGLSNPEAWSGKEFFFQATKSSYQCTFTYTFTTIGQMSGSCN